MVTKTWLGVHTDIIESTGCCAYLRGVGFSFHESSPNIFVKGSKRRDAHRKGASLCYFMGINSHFLSGNSIGSSVWVEALTVGQRGQRASKRPKVQPQHLNDRLLALRALTMLTMEFTSCVRYKAPISTSKSIHKVPEVHTLHKVCTQCKYVYNDQGRAPFTTELRMRKYCLES